MIEILDIAARQISVAIDVQNGEVSKMLKALQGDAARDGILRSGSYFVKIDRACAEVLVNRSTMVWQILHRCLTSTGTNFHPALSGKLKKFVMPIMNGYVDGLTTLAEREAKRLVPNMNLEKSLLESANARAQAVDWLGCEIDLYCKGLELAPKQPNYSPQSVITFNNSNVASVQTGDNATANVTQTLSNPAHAEALAALSTIRSEILNLQPSVPRDEALELITETVAELEMEKPSKARFSAYVRALKDFTVGILDQAPKIPQALESLTKLLDYFPKSP